MSSDHVQLNAAPRTERGSAPTRRLRKQGQVPCVLYGAGQESLAFSMDHHSLFQALSGPAGKAAVFEISVDGAKPVPALLKAWDMNPVRAELIHVDFQVVDLTATVQVSVPVVLVGTAVGVREGGVLDQPVHEILIEALPDAIPEGIEVGVDDLDIGGVLHLSDVVAPEGVTIIGDEEMVLASVTAPSTVEVAEPTGEEGLEGEEGAQMAGEDAGASDDEGAGESTGE